MSLRLRHDEDLDICRVEGDPGLVLSLAMIFAVDDELLAVGGDDPGCLRVLYDMRGVDTSQLRSDDLETLARRNAERWKDAAGGRAAVLSDETLGFGQARQYELLSEDRRVRAFAAFTDHDAAVAWLTAEDPGPSSA
jgi:hypothetical protein